jgi:hypothetical protein
VKCRQIREHRSEAVFQIASFTKQQYRWLAKFKALAAHMSQTTLLWLMSYVLYRRRKVNNVQRWS